MKKILFFINTLNGGGAEKVLVDLVNNLNPHEYEIDLVTVSSGVYQKKIKPNVNYRNMIKTDSKILKKFFTKLFYHLPVKLVNKLIKNGDYDIEIAYLEGFPTKVIAAGNSKAKKVTFVHCDVSKQNVLGKFYRSPVECVAEYERFDKVCFVSTAAMSGFEKSVKSLNTSAVIHNVIDFDNVKRLSKSTSNRVYSTRGIKLISIGRLSEEKGNERLVEVVSELENDYNLELWIIGDGPRRPAIENLIEKKNIKAVKLLGYQSNPYAFMSKADLLVCPSFYEGYSTVAAEAISLGLPVMTTDCAGMDEILDKGTCGLIVDNSMLGIKNGLLTVIKDKEYYNGIKLAAEKKSQNFTNDFAVKQYDDLFRELLE